VSTFRLDRDQALARLRAGDEIRLTRVAVKRGWVEQGIAAALADLAAIVELVPPWARSWRIGEALRAVPFVGRSRIADFCMRAGVERAARIGELTPDQRRAAAEELEAWARRTAARWRRPA
jgi:hypothetical protein